ncbi:MAG: hypothetical protein AVDCRST_MAG18-731 [uncultured Thermomicrobiales bacterium]|uniref:Uncharacterized protein n=1 Tax=uncultured Thermomicrobiales bacterium TaxID=1645740 RepID=A0A6J4USI3_9BACT|nr:MAG: hypothetical protein AVDCRST_MAG18-731 [uncultured Thermomicrobiales bacterium]
MIQPSPPGSPALADSLSSSEERGRSAVGGAGCWIAARTPPCRCDGDPPLKREGAAVLIRWCVG